MGPMKWKSGNQAFYYNPNVKRETAASSECDEHRTVNLTEHFSDAAQRIALAMANGRRAISRHSLSSNHAVQLELRIHYGFSQFLKQGLRVALDGREPRWESELQQ